MNVVVDRYSRSGDSPGGLWMRQEVLGRAAVEPRREGVLRTGSLVTVPPRRLPRRHRVWMGRAHARTLQRPSGRGIPGLDLLACTPLPFHKVEGHIEEPRLLAPESGGRFEVRRCALVPQRRLVLDAVLDCMESVIQGRRDVAHTTRLESESHGGNLRRTAAKPPPVYGAAGANLGRRRRRSA